MTEPTACCAARCPSLDAYCDSCDLLVGLEGLHVTEVERGPDRLDVTMESAQEVMGCRRCGVLAVSHGRRAVVLIDAPCFWRPVQVVWRKRTWSCLEPACPVGVFTEQDQQVARSRALLTVRACWWAVGQLRREHASVSGLARQLGTTWRTVWAAIKPLLAAMADDPGRRLRAGGNHAMAQRVGPSGQVLGMDIDQNVGAQAVTMLQAAGHTQCDFTTVNLEDDQPVPGAPYDLVCSRRLLLHVADPAAVLRRLYDAVTPGGHLVVHDYQLATTEVLPDPDVMREWRRVALGAFTAAGRDLHLGQRLPTLFTEAGVGAPDGTDVAGRLELMGAGVRWPSPSSAACCPPRSRSG